jgi:hypothetical protein
VRRPCRQQGGQQSARGGWLHAAAAIGGTNFECDPPLLHPRLRTALLPRELMNKNGRRVRLQYNILFGSVSISKDYHTVPRNLIVRFLQAKRFDDT